MFHKFVILLNLRSLFWPRLKPADENSGYCFIACAFYDGAMAHVNQFYDDIFSV